MITQNLDYLDRLDFFEMLAELVLLYYRLQKNDRPVIFDLKVQMLILQLRVQLISDYLAIIVP